MADALYIPALTGDIPLIAPQLKYFKIKSQILGADGWKSEEIFNQIEKNPLLAKQGVVNSASARARGHFTHAYHNLIR